MSQCLFGVAYAQVYKLSSANTPPLRATRAALGSCNSTGGKNGAPSPIGCAASPEALTESDLAARFTARGPWRTRLGNIREMLVTLGRARQEGDRYRAIGS